MEIIGKVLSLTLVTIFGSAAATVYLVDSDFFPSVLEKTPIIYSSATGTSEQSYTTKQVYIPENTNDRKRRSKEYYEVSDVQGQATTKGSDSIWGHSYSTDRHSRAEYLASENSLNSLKKEAKHWQAQYQNAIDQGQKRISKLAYSNYMDYQKAVEIKSKSQ